MDMQGFLRYFLKLARNGVCREYMVFDGNLLERDMTIISFESEQYDLPQFKSCTFCMFFDARELLVRYEIKDTAGVVLFESLPIGRHNVRAKTI